LRSFSSVHRDSAAIRAGIRFSSMSPMYDHVRLFARVSGAIAKDPSLSLGQLARALHIHPHTLAHIIGEHTGGSFSAWRGRHRLAAACQLLESRPDLSIKEIAAATGFNSTSVFDRFFRRSCGCSPSQCRLGASSRTPLSASTAAPAGASSEPSTCECGDPHGSGVDLLDPSSTDNGARDGEGSGRLESCTASS
jgi:AraC-like DNA-binding protein